MKHWDRIIYHVLPFPGMNRPFIHINCASTLDGKISKPDGSRLRISSKWDKERVHRLRNELGAILVGAGTIILDDPKLTVKKELVADPKGLDKIVIDGKGRIPVSSRFLRTEGRSIIVTSEECDREWYDGMNAVLEEDGVKLEIIQMKGRGTNLDLNEVLEHIYKIGITKLLVEGGSSIISEFVENELFDRFTVYFGPILIGGSGPTIMGGKGSMSPIQIRCENITKTPEGGFLVEMVNDRQ
jgi:riboflavin-specific deaminase-like protein